MKSIQLLPLLFLILACKGYESLTQQRVDFYKEKKVRFDGYFYTYGINIGNKTDDHHFDIFTLNRNGIYYDVVKGSIRNNLNAKEKISLFDKEFEFKIKEQDSFLNTRPNWGVFSIQGSDLEIQRWVFSSGGGKYATQKVFGKILNDSTIHFYEQERNNPTQYGKNKKREKINETYHFRKYSPKPDSTNQFIK